MVQIKTLPLLQDAKFIVIDEATQALRANDLISGWMQMWKGTTTPHIVDFLLFSDPKFTHDHLVDLFGKDSMRVHDYYTQDIHNIYQEKEIDLDSILRNFTAVPKSIVVVNCLNSLILTVGLSKAVKFVEKLGTRVAQLICIYRSDFGQNRVPKIETMGTTYLKLDCPNFVTLGNDLAYEVSLTHRKQSGGIVKGQIVIGQDISTYEIKSERQPSIHIVKSIPNTSETVVIKPQSTFRIEMSAREMEQRDKTPLPYIQNSSANESKILYVPDSIDDLDEEDPDDDLPF